MLMCFLIMWLQGLQILGLCGQSAFTSPQMVVITSANLAEAH